MTKLEGQHAVITGGGSGIGLAAAKAFARDGAMVTLVGRSADKLDAARTEIGDGAHTSVADVGDEDTIAAALEAANDRSPLTIVVANAGVGGAGPVLDMTVDDWQRVLQTNLTGAFLTIKHGGRHLVANGGGSMCAVSSIAGSSTHRFMASYTVSKAGLEMLVRNTADELGSLGVRVNAVSPGLVATDISLTLQNNQEVLADYLQNMPLGRIGQPEEIGEAIRFLCGPESSWITGMVMPIDGGHHLRRGPWLDPLLRPFADIPPPTSPDSIGAAFGEDTP